MREIRKNFTIRKLVAVILLVACGVFLAVNSTSLLREVSYVGGERFEGESDELLIQAGEGESLLGTQMVEQEFTAKTNRISMVGILVDNPGRYKASGKITLAVIDKQGSEIASASLDASMVANQALTYFSFNGDTEQLNEKAVVSDKHVNYNKKGVKIKKDELYTIRVASEDVQSERPVGLLSNQKTGEQIFNKSVFLSFAYKVFAFFLALLAAVLIAVLFPLPWLQEKLNQRGRQLNLNRLAQTVLFILTPFAAFFVIQKVSGMGTIALAKMLFHLNGLLNLLIIVAFWWAVFTISNRFGLTSILTIAVFFVFAFICKMLIIYRDAPLMYNDLFLWKTAFSVAKTYSITINKSLVWGIVVTIAWIALVLAFREEKGCKTWKMRLIPLAVTVILASGMWAVFSSDYLDQHHIYFSSFKPKRSYNSHGYLLGFAMTVQNASIKKPEGYSKNEIKKLTERYISDQADEIQVPTESNPNVIVIMNESFTDYEAVGEVHINQDYMPFFHSLKENTIKGTLHTSVYGGHTANTEFEFLTGNTVRFLPTNAVPYRTMIRDKMGSLAWNLKDQGYTGNVAFHPGTRTSYSRDVAYPNLGFDKHVSVEDVQNLEKIRAYVSDTADYEYVEKEYEECRKQGTEPFFMFNVTIQNHARYLFEEGVVEPEVIKITDPNQYDEEAYQFMNLMNLSDKALEQLIKYYSNIQEPTVIVFFGDHQPKLGEAFYNVLLSKGDDQLSFAENEQKYHVPFMIWTNYDIEEENGIDISANYLHAFLMQKTGGKMTGYEKYLMDLYKDIPVLTNICYMDKQGKLYDRNSKTALKKKVDQYERLQYSIMFDKKSKPEKFLYLQH